MLRRKLVLGINSLFVAFRCQPFFSDVYISLPTYPQHRFPAISHSSVVPPKEPLVAASDEDELSLEELLGESSSPRSVLATPGDSDKKRAATPTRRALQFSPFPITAAEKTATQPTTHTKAAETAHRHSNPTTAPQKPSVAFVEKLATEPAVRTSSSLPTSPKPSGAFFFVLFVRCFANGFF